jgi:aerobic-type carbon monoxide dehydrogenase small subunit (CoxS/CutS family)
MGGAVSILINGQPIAVAPGTTVAAALLRAGVSALRHSVTGAPRGPLCGMGICFECRVIIDGIPQRLSCQTLCTAGMEVRTDGP